MSHDSQVDSDTSDVGAPLLNECATVSQWLQAVKATARTSRRPTYRAFRGAGGLDERRSSREAPRLSGIWAATRAHGGLFSATLRPTAGDSLSMGTSGREIAMAVGWPLVGRREELDFIGAILARSSRGAVVLAGAPGVGKTRLLREASTLARQHGLATEFVIATRAASTIPFGAFAHLLPPVPAVPSGRLDILREAIQLLRERAAARRLMVLIDDAHILDDASAALLQMLATTDGVLVVTTVRTGEPAGHIVSGLVKDGLAQRIEVQALSQAETEHLVDLVLPGHVDGAAKHHLWNLSRGNALYLKELMVSALAGGTLVTEAEVWRWSGALVASHLMDLVGSSLGRLKPAERRVLDVLAAGEPLGQAELYRCAEPAAIDAVGRRGLVEFVEDQRRHLVHISHPLYTEAIKASANPHRDQQIRRQLADALEATGARRREDVLRIAKWRLDAAARSSPDLLCAAAVIAMSALDDALAERLARAAIESGAGLKAQMLLGMALIRQQRATDADALLSGLEKSVETDEERARLAEMRAFNFFNLGLEQEGLAVLRDAESKVSDPGWLHWLLGLRSEFFVATGRPLAALEAAERVLSHTEEDSPLAIRAIISVVPALAMNGRGEDAVRVADRAIPTALRVADRIPVTFGSELGSLAAVQLRETRFLGLRISGRFEEMVPAAEGGYAESLQFLHGGPRVLWAGARGQAALDQGRVRTAASWLREGVALAQQDFRSAHLLALWLANLAKALAWLNETEEARQKLSAATAALHPAVRFHDAELEIAAAWVLAAEGDISAARARCVDAAQRFGEFGQHFFEVILLHDLVRLGAPQKASARLAELAETVQGQFVKVCARQAQAAAVMDGSGLEDASEAFRHMGGYLLAAEAAAQAAHAYRQAGRVEKARSAAQRSERLAEHCEGARTPILAEAEQALPLTAREREVATLAARGLTSRAIAERLSVSVRTVENHLQICYSKLGISGRGELGSILDV